MIEWEEDAEVAHAHCHVSDVSDGMRQSLSYLDDVGLRGAEDGNWAIRLLAIFMQIWVVVGIVVMEAEGGARRWLHVPSLHVRQVG